MINNSLNQNLITKDENLNKLDDLLKTYDIDLCSDQVCVSYDVKNHSFREITFETAVLSGCLVKIIIGLLEIFNTKNQFCYDFDVMSDAYDDETPIIILTPIYKNI